MYGLPGIKGDIGVPRGPAGVGWPVGTYMTTRRAMNSTSRKAVNRSMVNTEREAGLGSWLGGRLLRGATWLRLALRSE
jgi:hypothetical protein